MRRLQTDREISAFIITAVRLTKPLLANFNLVVIQLSDVGEELCRSFRDGPRGVSWSLRNDAWKIVKNNVKVIK